MLRASASRILTRVRVTPAHAARMAYSYHRLLSEKASSVWRRNGGSVWQKRGEA